MKLVFKKNWTKQINYRSSEEDYRKLSKLASKKGVSLSELIRVIVTQSLHD